MRPIKGIEAFQLVGWGHSYFWRPIRANHHLLTNMRGNAFSGLAVMPMLMVAFTGMELHIPAEEEAPTADVKAVASSPELEFDSDSS